MTRRASDKLRQLRAKLEKTKDMDKDYDFILEDVPLQIMKRTRLGKGVDEGGALTKLKPLSDKYVDKRKKYKPTGPTTAKKSNLTFTGQMLESIKGIRQGSLFRFFFDPKRDDGESNDKLAQYAREKGRRFFDLSKTERNGLRRKIAKVLKEKIIKLFNA